jgi:hypothetical protein
MDSLTKATSTTHNPATTHLDFSNQDRLTDKKLINEITGSSAIEKLTFKGCTCLKLKDKTIRVLAERLNHLKELDLSGCTRITNRAISQYETAAVFQLGAFVYL